MLLAKTISREVQGLDDRSVDAGGDSDYYQKYQRSSQLLTFRSSLALGSKGREMRL